MLVQIGVVGAPENINNYITDTRVSAGLPAASTLAVSSEVTDILQRCQKNCLCSQGRSAALVYCVPYLEFANTSVIVDIPGMVGRIWVKYE